MNKSPCFSIVKPHYQQLTKQKHGQAITGSIIKHPFWNDYGFVKAKASNMIAGNQKKGGGAPQYEPVAVIQFQ